MSAPQVLRSLLDATQRQTVDRRVTAEKRMSVCRACDKLEQKVAASICAECGCILEHKVERAGDSCPLGKW